MGDEHKRNLEITWPLYREDPRRRFPSDAQRELSSYTPNQRLLRELSELPDVPESAGNEASIARALKESMPPGAPDWMRAAQTMVHALSKMLSRPETVTDPEQAAVARAWAAWSLGGASEAHVLRVAHLVARAHGALRERSAGDSETAHTGAARVLHAGLPSALRASMPLDRVLFVIRHIDREPDQWVAVVYGTSELLGWADYARVHAASVIRTAIESDHEKRHVPG